ncbi:MAG: HAMP domain-containing sensor histidine kinase [Elusimicrobiota bacterium]|nr:HAMP domain-containing sensor histidine kinase [Elusimicrobiota bacterium]
MSIRVKLALILSLAVAAATGTAAATFVAIERRSLRRAEDEKVRLLMQNVRAMAEESQLARDPLMLLDYLAFLDRDREEVLFTRARLGGRWESHRDAIAPPSSEPVRLETAVAPARGDAPEAAAEVVFSRRVLDRRLQQAYRLMARDLGSAAAVVLLLGILVSVPLGWTLSSRLVAMERALAEIGAGKLTVRVPDDGSDEVARLARGLNDMSARLRELDELKRTFVASVTHELRSPLGAIESYVKALLRDARGLSEDERRQLERVRENAARLAHFVTSLLDMAKIERGKLDFHPRMTDLSRVVEDTVLFLRTRAQEDGKTLDFKAESGLPSLPADADLVTQVVTNLVSNAVKFTRAGGRVDVSVRRVPDGLEVSVADNGVGIPPEALSRIFAPFERVRNPLKAGGAGLGLAISKAIVEMHKGRIGVASEPGRGSRFHFVLPVGPPPSPTPPADNKSLIGKPG